MKAFLTTCLWIVILFFIFAWVLQRQFIYFPTKQSPQQQKFHAEDLGVITLLTQDNLSLKSWYKPAPKGYPTLLFLHGNAGHIGFRMPLVRQFITEKMGVLLLEYRGFGGNPGSPTEQGLYNDARAAIQFLQQQGVKKIILYGESLGTGVATQLATEYPVCAVILQSPYTSLRALAVYHYFWLPVPLRDRYDSLARIQTIHAPILFLEGTEDQIVPYSQSIELFNHANEPKQWVEFPGKGHHNLWDQAFVAAITQFIHRYCP